MPSITPPKPPRADSPFWKVWEYFARANVAIYRRSGGRFGGKWLWGAPVLLLTHVGRKSGQQRVSPVLYLRDGDRLVIVASKGGTDKNPAWFHNLMANPDTTVQVGRETRRVRARRADAAKRDELWPRLVEMYRPFEDYQRYTTRRIPVVILDPAE